MSRLSLVKVELPNKDETQALLDEIEQQREKERKEKLAQEQAKKERYEQLPETLNSQKGRVK